MTNKNKNIIGAAIMFTLTILFLVIIGNFFPIGFIPGMLGGMGLMFTFDAINSK